MENEAIINQFNQFTKSIDYRIAKFIKSKDKQLTMNIAILHVEFWGKLKEINGTSAGFSGLSEYIVFSVFKKYIEDLNGKKFESKPIDKNRKKTDLHCFGFKKNKKTLEIYRSSNLKHYPNPINSKSEEAHQYPKQAPAPDIGIVKKEGQKTELIAVIEIKNVLDGTGLKSALDMIDRVSTIGSSLENNQTKYAIFSFGPISADLNKLKDKWAKFKKDGEKNSLITYNVSYKDIREYLLGNNSTLRNNTPKHGSIDLSEFLNKIKDKLTL